MGRIFRQLPIKVDIIKHAKEIDGKSTSAHAAVLAPDDVNIYTFPCIPDYDTTKEKVRVQNYDQQCRYLLSTPREFFFNKLNLYQGKSIANFKWNFERVQKILNKHYRIKVGR